MLGFLLFVPKAFSQAASDTSGSMSNTEVLLLVVIVLVLIVAIVILVVAVYLINVIKLVLLEEKKRLAEESGQPFVEPVKEPNFLQKLLNKATDSVPVTKEDTVMLDHDYDGIKELDNHLPPWWKWLFYFTIGWSAIYLLVYHVFGVFPLMEEEYDIEIERAQIALEERMEQGLELIDENTVEFTEVAEDLANGKSIFNRQCASCHRTDGGGQIGPNLTDDYWVHGGSINQIFSTIKYGVPAKGMISWQTMLSPSDMRDVGSYIMTLRGTNPPNPKEPEGELYTPETQENEAPVESDTLEIAMN
jgi:cytochrome c oxidase cbb3-type subunit 3